MYVFVFTIGRKMTTVFKCICFVKKYNVINNKSNNFRQCMLEYSYQSWSLIKSQLSI